MDTWRQERGCVSQLLFLCGEICNSYIQIGSKALPNSAETMLAYIAGWSHLYDSKIQHGLFCLS